ncbi:MAG: hypothetical protein HC846_02630 [Blastocatellia bacterium]|nr:hypothetical protein [Blastocatellia bacterium]
MNKRLSNKSLRTLYAFVSAALIFAFSLQGYAQTAADTAIKNTASATYDDGNGNNFDTVSNEVTVTVAKVAGLAITPDGQNNSAVVAGQTGVTMNFTVTNTGNFDNDVRFWLMARVFVQLLRELPLRPLPPLPLQMLTQL